MIKIISTLYTYQLEKQMNDFFNECEKSFIVPISYEVKFYKLYQDNELVAECHAIILYRKVDFDEV